MQLGCVAVRVNSIGRSGQRPAAPMCERVISSRYGATVERRCHARVLSPPPDRIDGLSLSNKRVDSV